MVLGLFDKRAERITRRKEEGSGEHHLPVLHVAGEEEGGGGRGREGGKREEEGGGRGGRGRGKMKRGGRREGEGGRAENERRRSMSHSYFPHFLLVFPFSQFHTARKRAYPPTHIFVFHYMKLA